MYSFLILSAHESSKSFLKSGCMTQHSNQNCWQGGTFCFSYWLQILKQLLTNHPVGIKKSQRMCNTPGRKKYTRIHTQTYNKSVYDLRKKFIFINCLWFYFLVSYFCRLLKKKKNKVYKEKVETICVTVTFGWTEPKFTSKFFSCATLSGKQTRIRKKGRHSRWTVLAEFDWESQWWSPLTLEKKFFQKKRNLSW